MPGQLLDVCIDNGLDDVTGEQRLERNAAVVATGPVTRRALCASRLALGLPVNRADMAAGSPEEALLLANAVLPVPANVATDGRWIFIDLTCQILLTGDGPAQLVNVFPTSTGELGFETRLQEQSRAFRFDPALESGGWHESTEYPVPEDNPLNGNMYKPLYFDNGQAIHGGNNVPTSPQSKGCARLKPADHDAWWPGWASTPSMAQPFQGPDRRHRVRARRLRAGLTPSMPPTTCRLN